MKKTIITLVTLILSHFVSGQNPVFEDARQTVVDNASLGYYITNEKTVRSVWIIKNNPKERAGYIIIPDQINHKNNILYPQDILGYGFEDDGSQYLSARITLNGESKHVFLEVLIHDNDTTIYAYPTDQKEHFFLQKGNQTARLIADKEELRSYFKSRALNCPDIHTIDHYPMKLSRASITKMYEAYTHCNLNVFRRFRYGVTASVYLAKLKIGNDNSVNYKVKAVFCPGIFIDIPLDIRFSLRPEFVFMDYKTTGNPKSLMFGDYSMDYERKSILIPFLFRANINQFSKRWIPYVELGPTIDFRLSGKNYDHLLEGRLNVSRFQFGGALGAGVAFKVNNLLSLYAGLRFNASVGHNTAELNEVLNMYSFHLSVGF